MRPLYEYKVVFSHPPTPERDTGYRIEIPVVETTPCRAKNTALVRHATLLKADTALPDDNLWAVSAVLSIRQIGFREG